MTEKLYRKQYTRHQLQIESNKAHCLPAKSLCSTKFPNSISIDLIAVTSGSAKSEKIPLSISIIINKKIWKIHYFINKQRKETESNLKELIFYQD